MLEVYKEILRVDKPSSALTLKISGFTLPLNMTQLGNT